MANTLPPNDDDYTAPIPIGFDVFFGNEFHSTLRISNNGYVTFGPQTPLWWILRAWESFNVPLIALFHTDVDTRPPGASPVTWGPITFGGRQSLCVNWVDVGYYDMHDEVLNRFQMILVDRGETGVGNFDIYMNYDRIEWDDVIGNGSVPPRVGIYDGTSVLHELPGSNAVGTLIDGGANALAHHSAGSAVLGRYLFELRDGLQNKTPVITGTVTDTNNALVDGALVQACSGCGLCVFDSTDNLGHYNLHGLQFMDIPTCDKWQVTVWPPAGSSLLPNDLTPLAVILTADDQIAADANIVLDYPEYVPSGTSITPSNGGGFGAVPRVYWQAPLTLTTTGCSSGTARYMITRDGGQDLSRCDTGTPSTDSGLIQCGSMTETPPVSGTYVASIPALAPAHGQVKVTMGLTCGSQSGTSSFDLYIDPSGWVQTLHGAPLAGALVTLYRSESPLGPFEVVPDGSALMSPKNRTNPDHTDSAGHFAWDTVAGFYVVRAEYPGCVAPGNPLQTYVETDVLPVPPEWLDLHLYLDCGAITPPHLSVPTQVLADATSTAGAVVSYQVSAVDDHDDPVPVTCSSPPGGLFPVGTTTVTCSAQNAMGNTATGSFPVIVSYAWSNVLSPLHPGAGNQINRGRTVPVKLALTGASAQISNLVAHLYVAAMSGGAPGPEVPARSAGNGPNDLQFRYDPHAHEYIFNWSTKGLSEGHYQLRIDLGDGTTRTVPVELK
ncbi:MAG TPA: PxKF domain-containing protein [Kofleriaceae bacterium]|nr:PxKF domain-containing protein [Kofleriaceae bacterium]